jgi:hypothetical protein
MHGTEDGIPGLRKLARGCFWSAYQPGKGVVFQIEAGGSPVNFKMFFPRQATPVHVYLFVLEICTGCEHATIMIRETITLVYVFAVYGLWLIRHEDNSFQGVGFVITKCISIWF